tara:strand:+ start:823 stop:966 length:144 start_codon:yes stop_codon:yes gene_type:complete
MTFLHGIIGNKAAAGSEMSTYKKYLKKYPDEIQKSIYLIMGGFYKDI